MAHRVPQDRKPQQNRSSGESTLLATCPRCGDVEVPVRATAVGRGAATGPCWYAFACPACSRRVQVEADPHLATVLTCLGAREDLMPSHDTGAAPLTVDDVLDLTLDLHATDDLAAAFR